MSYEEEFDSQLREKFIIILFLATCFGVSFAMLLMRRAKREETDDPFFCVILSSICLAFAISSLFVIPLDQAVQSFPPAVTWLGINGIRLARSFASISMLGCTFSILILNPFAFLWGEAPDTSWGSFWTTLFEVALLLLMIFCMSMLYFTGSTVTEALMDPSKVLIKLTSILMHGPGCLMFLYVGPQGMSQLITSSLARFVPWVTPYSPADARRLKDELTNMKEWTKKRMGSVNQSDIEDLEHELQVVERAVNGHPILRNAQGFLYTMVSSGLIIAIVFRVLLPNTVAERLFSKHSVIFSVLLPCCFLGACLLAFTGYSRIEQFFVEETQVNGAKRVGSKRRSRECVSINENSPGLTRTDSNLSLQLSDPLSLAWFVTYTLMFCSSSPIVLAGMFGLDVSFELSCHPFLRHPYVTTLFSVVFVVLFSRVLGNSGIQPNELSPDAVAISTPEKSKRN